MYRKSLTMSDTTVLPQLEIVARMYQLPVVNVAYSYASSFYGKAKDSSPLLNKALTTAESTMVLAVDYSAPVVEKFENQIRRVDNLACQGLQMVEEKLPLIKQEPQEIVKSTTAYISNHVPPTRTLLDDAQTLAKSQLTRSSAILLKNQYSQYAVSGVNSVLNIAEGYLDTYLPSEDEEARETKDASNEKPEDGSSISDTVGRVATLTTKTGRRLSKVMTSQLSNLKMRNEEVVSHLVTVNLIQYAKDYVDTVKTDVKNVWTEVSNGKQLELRSDSDSLPGAIKQRTAGIVQNVVKSGKFVTDSILDVTKEPRNELMTKWTTTSTNLQKIFSHLKQDGKLSDLPEAVTVISVTTVNTAWDTVKICTLFALGTVKTFIVPSTPNTSVPMKEFRELDDSVDEYQETLSECDDN